MLRLAAIAVLAVATGSPPAEHRVYQKGKMFSVPQLRVRAGDRVVFHNDDMVTHNVFSTSDRVKFNLKTQAPRASAQTTFTGKGVAQVRCAFHPNMKLTVVVD